MKLKHFTVAAFAVTAICGWQTSNAQSWNLPGNSNATTSSKLGTTNAIPLNLTTNNQTRAIIDANTGNMSIGIGTNIVNASYRLHVTGGSTGSILGEGSSYGVAGRGTYGVYGTDGGDGFYGVFGHGIKGRGVGGSSESDVGGFFMSKNTAGIRAVTINGTYAGVFDGNV